MRVAMSMLVLAIAMALPAMEARAAESDTMSVTGAITNESGCTLSFSNGGAINYGLILVASLNQSTATSLPLQTLSASVACTTPTYMAMQIADVRPNDISYGDLYKYGLGATRTGNPIGSYIVHTTMNSAIVDGISRRIGQSYSPPAIGMGWGLPGGGDFWPKGYYRTFVDNQALAVQVSAAQFGIDVRAFVESRDALQIQGAESIDGQFVIDIYYM